MNADTHRRQPAVHIGHLRLRIPGTDAEAGRAFARQFADELAARSQGLATTHIGALGLRIRPAADQSTPDAIAARAADSVIARLNSRGQHHA